jgi:hypothetical protein
MIKRAFSLKVSARFYQSLGRLTTASYPVILSVDWMLVARHHTLQVSPSAIYDILSKPLALIA